MTAGEGAGRPLVYLTDRTWDDLSLERQVIESAGYAFRSAPRRSLSAPLPSAAALAGIVATDNVVGLLTCLAPISADVLEASARLRAVTRVGSGVDNIDVDAARARGVLVGNVPDYCVEEVSDHAVAMVLNWARGLLPAAEAVRRGEPDPPGIVRRRVADLNCGVIGYGLIGRAIARKLSGLGATVAATRRRRPDTDSGLPGVRIVPLADLLAGSDVVIVATPLTPQTHHLIDADALARMPAGSLLVNVGRGPVVDTASLTAALASGHLSSVALDVWEGEPQPPAGLVGLPGAVLTPHVAYASDKSLANLRTLAARRLVEVLSRQARS